MLEVMSNNKSKQHTISKIVNGVEIDKEKVDESRINLFNHEKREDIRCFSVYNKV